MQVPRGQVDDVVARAWQWMKSDPKNMTAVLSLPLVLGQMVSEEDVPSSVELRWRPGEHQAALTS